MSYLGIFRTEFEKATAIFEFNTLEYFKKCKILRKTKNP